MKLSQFIYNEIVDCNKKQNRNKGFGFFIGKKTGLQSILFDVLRLEKENRDLRNQIIKEI